jgi:membrane fusion protein (multidrug efflux system)
MPLNRVAWVSLACALMLTACQQGDSEQSADATEEEDATPVPVETTRPVRGDIFAVYSGTAPVEAIAEADVVARVGGEVRQLAVEEGDVVSNGQLLATLDGDRLKLELEESSARLRKLQRDFQRNNDLRDKGLISEGEFEKIKYEMEALQASHNLASLELEYTRIRASIDGVISQRYIKLGNTVKPGDPLFRITSMDPLVTYLHVPEREFRKIRPGQAVAIDIDALQGQRVMASVTRVSPVVDPATGTFKITIEISDPGRTIKPGMFGRVSIVYDTHENALQVPRSAVQDEGGEQSVFVVEDGKAKRRQVSIGFSDKGMMEITSGIDDDDAVVTLGQAGLKNDALVTVIGAEEQETPADAPAD